MPQNVCGLCEKQCERCKINGEEERKSDKIPKCNRCLRFNPAPLIYLLYIYITYNIYNIYIIYIHFIQMSV